MSPKNKGKFGKGKPAIEPQDEFVSGVQRVSEKLRPHAAKIFTFLGVVLVGVAGWSTWSCVKYRRNTAATAAYAEAVSASRREIDPPKTADGDAGVDQPEPDDGIGEDEIRYSSDEERQRAVLAALEGISGKAKVAGHARLLEAATHLRLGEFDRAAELFRAYSGPAEMAWLAREGTGYALEGKATADKDAAAREAGLREALEAFRAIASEAGDSGYDLRLWHEARLQAHLGEKDAAVTTFEKLRDLDPPSPLKAEAENRLAMLRAKKVAATPPAPAEDPTPAPPAPTPPAPAPATP